MKRFALLLLLLCAMFTGVSGADEESWLVVLEYDNGVVTIVEQIPFDGPAPSIVREGDYTLTTDSGFEENFDFPLITLYDSPTTELFNDDGEQIFTPEADDVMVVEEKAQIEFIIPKASVGGTLSVKDAGGTVVVEAPMIEGGIGTVITPPVTDPPGNGDPPDTGNGGLPLVTDQNTTVPPGDNLLLLLGGGALIVVVIVLVVGIGLLYIISRMLAKKPKRRKK